MLGASRRCATKCGRNTARPHAAPLRDNRQRAGAAPVCGAKGDEWDPITADLYEAGETAGIPAEALLASLGCGNPTALADLQPGEMVLDLGSGGGIDVLLSAQRVGPTGKAYGLDMTDEMLALARENQAKSGADERRVPPGATSRTFRCRPKRWT